MCTCSRRISDEADCPDCGQWLCIGCLEFHKSNGCPNKGGSEMESASPVLPLHESKRPFSVPGLGMESGESPAGSDAGPDDKE